MSDHKEEFPGGIEVNEGGSIPTFLKITYVGFTIFAFAYWFLYRGGDGSPLVQILNSFTG